MSSEDQNVCLIETTERGGGRSEEVMLRPSELKEAIEQGCTTYGLRARSGPRSCYIAPLEQVTKYKKLLMNDRDLMD